MAEKPDKSAQPAIEDIFAQFGDLFSDLFGTATATAAGDVSTVLVLTPEELRAGTVRTVEVRHPGECSACDSTECPSCAGHGTTQRTQGFFTVQTSCATCAGVGRRFDKRCSSCRGSGDVVDSVEVVVPPNSQPQQPIGIDEAGNLSRDGKRRGHLYVWLDVKGGTELPKARLHSSQSRTKHITRFALALAALIGAAAILSLLL